VSTQREMARRLNVSQITVSRALRGSPNVSPSLRERILAEARRQGYAFNEVARSFARGKTGRLGVVVPNKQSFENRFFCGVLVGLSAAAKEAGLSLVFLDMSGFSGVGELRRAVNGADGFVAYGCVDLAPWMERLDDTLSAARKPFVFVQHNRSCRGPCVAIDDTWGSGLAVEHLRGLGHRRIAFYGGRQNLSSTERLDGYIEALRRAGEPVRDDLISWRNEPDGGVFLERMRALPAEERPTGLFVYSDLVAVGVLYEAAVGGFRVPAELSVVGYSDFVLFPTLFHPYLTTVHVPAAEAGERAVRLVMEPPASPGEHIELLKPTLVVRESTAPPGLGAEVEDDGRG